MGDIELRHCHHNSNEPSPSAPDESNLTSINNSEAFEDAPPNGGYGWVCTFCCCMINIHTWGINSSWGVILAHFLSNSTYPNASHLDYAFIGGLSIAMCLLLGPVVTKVYNIIGSKLTMLMGTGLVFGSLLGASYSTEIWHLFLSQGICFGTGMGFLYITATAVLPEWFSTRRSFSMGLAASGAGLGGVLYNLAAGAAIQAMGIAATYRVLAFCALGGNLISSLLMKDRRSFREERRGRTFNHRDLSHFEVLLMVLWGVTTELGYVTLVYSLPNYATSIGLNPQQGSITGAILNLGLTIGRPLVGYFSDALGRITISTVMTAFCGLFCFAIWIPAYSFAPLILFSLLAGMVCGTFWGTITPVTAEVVGLNRLPSTFAMICLTLVVPTTFAEPVALSIVASSGYLSTQVYVASMFILGATSLWVLRSWKFYEIEMKAARESEGIEVNGASTSFPSFFRWIRPRKLFLNGRV
ncbi:transporter [Aspergillus sclerotialis]|uniref:Transporter n=1 Tax=Aspergillus sclerotialis TaxID=2070753 RepID=A0A3A2ZIG0_9EURO|nr:transporter [Aspergillus sclerotialis]